MERRSILHLSDLHFGRHSDAVVESVFHFARSLSSPLELIIVTGDLTQRAKSSEFRQAAAFLQRLQELREEPLPILVIPGNHDVSLFNPFRRFLWPFRSYDRWIASKYGEVFENDCLSVVGLRTNNLRTVAEGRLSKKQVELCREHFGRAGGKMKILAVHHPLLESLASPYAREILGTGPNLVLSGHRHRYGIVKMMAESKIVLSLSAGTAVSTRTRSEENSFNCIEYASTENTGRIFSVQYGEDGFQIRKEEAFPLPWAKAVDHAELQNLPKQNLLNLA